MNVLNNFTAINTGQNLPILQLSRDVIIKTKFNPKTEEIQRKKSENKYDEKHIAEDCQPLLNLSQTSKELTYEIANSQQNIDELKDSAHLFHLPKTQGKAAIKDIEEERDAENNEDEEHEDHGKHGEQE